MSNPRHWWVVSPEMSEVVHITDDGRGPMEYGCEVVTVVATTKREAKLLGVRAMTKWPQQARGDGMNPFSGLRIEDPRCPHRVCMCDLCGNEECGQCESDSLGDADER